MIKVKIITLLAMYSISAYAVKSKTCSDINIGESKKVNIPSLLSRTKVEFKYTIKRTKEDLYDIFINYDFKRSTIEKLFGYQNREQADGTYKEYIQGCFDKYNNKLEDGLGRKLRLHVFNPNIHKKITTPPKVRIKIADANARSNSRVYASRAKCSTIIHEAFHLLGLPDEYRERWNSWNPHYFGRVFRPIVSANTPQEYAYNCRSLGSDTSVMRNPHELDYFNNILHSKHIDVVIYPNCKKKNEIFFKCSKNSYRTSKDHGVFLGCKDVPADCRNGDWYGI